MHRLVRDDGRVLLLKRDDLSGTEIGGNKLRALEWLLGGVRSGDQVLTVGARGSTHALSTAMLAGQLGARCTVVRWNQVMNPAAEIVERRLRSAARVIDTRLVPARFGDASGVRGAARLWP